MDKMFADPFGYDHSTDQKVRIITDQPPQECQCNATTNRDIGREELFEDIFGKTTAPRSWTYQHHNPHDQLLTKNNEMLIQTQVGKAKKRNYQGIRFKLLRF